MFLHQEKNTIKIGSKALLIFFIYVVFVWFCEVSDFIVFFSGGKNQYVYFSALISGLLTIFLFFRFRKCLEFDHKPEVDWLYFCGVAFIVLFGFYKCVIPDAAYDTWNYHLAAQDPGFINYFEDHFGLGRFEIWGFRLSDRLFYIFRVILGYRMGTALNTIVLVLAYYQLVQIMQMFNNQLPRQLPNSFTEIGALFICSSQWILFDLGIYYVDILALPVAFEVIRLLMQAGNSRPTKLDIIYFAMLNGFWLAFKMTNVVFVVPACILFIAISRIVNFRTLILFAFLGVAPCVIYLIFNYYCTGNPIYPYYNTIFKSDLFPILNFKDNRYGPIDIVDKFTWLYHAVSHPENRLSQIYDEFNIRYIIAFILMMFEIDLYLISRLKSSIRRKQENYYHMEIVVFVLLSSVLWGWSTGYGRYFIFGIIMMEFVAFGTVAIIYAKLHSGVRVFSALLGILTGILCFYEFALMTSVLNGQEWSWRNSYPSKTNVNMQKNMQYLLHDQEYRGSFNAGKVDAYIISSTELNSYAHWLTPDAYVFNLSYLEYLSNEKKTLFKAKLAEVLRANDNVYDIVRIGTKIDDYAKKMSVYGISVEKVSQVDTNVVNILIVKLKQNH